MNTISIAEKKAIEEDYVNKQKNLATIFAALMFVLFSVIGGTRCYASSALMVYDTGKAMEVDLEKGAVTGLGTFDGIFSDVFSRDTIAIEPEAKRIFFVDYENAHFQVVKAFDLSSRTYIGQLNYSGHKVVGGVDAYNTKIYSVPGKKEIIVKWWDEFANNSAGEQVIGIFNSVDFKKIREHRGSSPTEKLMTSNTGDRLDLIYDNVDSSRVENYVYDKLERVNTVNFEAAYSAEIFSKSVIDFKNNKLLCVENAKADNSEDNKYVFFVFDVQSRNSSNKVPTGTEGKLYLVNKLNIVVLAEEKDLLPDYPYNTVNTGRILFYNPETEGLIGTAVLNEYQYISFLGTTPDESKLILDAQTPDRKGNIVVIDTSTYQVLKTIAYPGESIYYMHFLD